jgi:hypothetical protein
MIQTLIEKIKIWQVQELIMFIFFINALLI